MSDASTRLAGEWTIHAIAQHRAHVLGLVEQGQYELDVSGITDMDSAGLQLLLSTKRALEKQGKALCLSHIPPAVKHVLTSYGLDTDLHPLSFEGAAT